MAESPKPSTLDADILWQIFSCNTFSDENFTEPIAIRKNRQDGKDSDEEDVVQHWWDTLDMDDETESSLITARHTSQVCTFWRQIMLASPNIWANTMNLRHLQQESDAWRTEVLRRTGTALLSLIGHRLRADTPGTEFFFSLLKSEAGRIRRISTSSTFSRGGVGGDSRWNTLFFRPAPYLEIMRFQYRHGQHHRNIIFLNQSSADTQDSPPVPATLFRNKAPKLHTLILRGVKAYIGGLWNPNIRHLDIQWSDIRYSLLPSLNQMQALQTLCLEGVTIEDSPKGRFKLPQLRQFTLNSSIHYASNFLEIIEPSLDCSSTIKITEGMLGVSSPGPLESHFRQGITAHMQGRFSNQLFLKITEDFIHIHNGISFSIPGSVAPFNISVDFVLDTLPCLLLDIMSGLSSICITSVSLEISKSWYRDLLDESIDNFFNTLDSLETLHIKCRYLDLLTERLHSPEDCVPPFPNLHTLVLDDRHSAQVSFEPIMAFIERRRAVGFPLKKLDLSRCMGLHANIIGSLNSIMNLNVTCGVPLRANLDL